MGVNGCVFTVKFKRHRGKLMGGGVDFGVSLWYNLYGVFSFKRKNIRRSRVYKRFKFRKRGSVMLKYILIAAIALALSFFLAGIASNIPVSPSWLWKRGAERETRYRFYLGCALFTTLCVAGAMAAAGGYVYILVPCFVFALIGAVMAVFCVFSVRKFYTERFGKFRPNGGGNYECPIGSHGDNGGCECRAPIGSCVERCENDQSANGVEWTSSEENAFENGEQSTSNSEIGIKTVGLLSLITEKTRTKAIIWCAIFAVSVVIFSVFYILSDNLRLYSANGGVSEKTVVFETADKTDDTVYIMANSGADTYAIIGYGAENGTFDALVAAVNGEREFAVRYAIIEQGEWSGYYLLLDVKDGDGVSYLDENEVLEARTEARAEKLVLFGVLTLICGGICIFYTVMTVCKKRIV